MYNPMTARPAPKTNMRYHVGSSSTSCPVSHEFDRPSSRTGMTHPPTLEALCQFVDLFPVHLLPNPEPSMLIVNIIPRLIIMMTIASNSRLIGYGRCANGKLTEATSHTTTTPT